MNKIKDFFYNKNDIIIVLIILIAAAFIIYWRIDAIMAYPEKLAEKTAQQQETETTLQENSSSADASQQTQASETTAASTTGANVSITITDSDSSISVATKLYEAGLVASDTEFEGYISNMGKSSSIKSGTFQIPKGSSNEEILKIIAN